MRVHVFALASALVFASAAVRAEEGGDPDARPPQKVHPLIAGGLSRASLFGLELDAKRFEAGGAIDVARSWTFTLGAGVGLGETEARLGTGYVDLFGTIDLSVGRLRFGIGPELSYLWMSRAPSSGGSSIDALGLGVRGHATLDVIRFDGARAVFVAVVPEAEWVWGTSKVFDLDRGTGLLRASGMAGVRF